MGSLMGHAVDAVPKRVLVVGCSHPGVEKIIEAAGAINPNIRLVAGGFHLVVATDEIIARAVAALKDNFEVESIASGHCTGEPTFAALKHAFATGISMPAGSWAPGTTGLCLPRTLRRRP